MPNERSDLQQFVARRYRALGIFALLLIVVALAGLGRVTVSSDQNIFFSETNPERLEFEAFETRFGEEEAINFTLGRDDRDLWDTEGLAAIRWLSDRAERLPHVARVQSLVNFQYSRAADDDIEIGDFIPRSTTPTPAFIAARRAEAAADPRITGLLLAADGRTAGVFATVNSAGIGDLETARVFEAAQMLVADFRTAFPAIDIHFSGGLAVDKSFQLASLNDGETLNLLMVVVFALITLLVWRSVPLALCVLGFLAVLAGATMGCAGWFGYPVTPVSAVAPVIVMSLFLANVVHITHAYLSAIERGLAPADAARCAVAETLLPMVFTALTTLIGFASLNFADSPPFRHFGNLVLVGVVLAGLASVTLFPSLLPRCKPRRAGVYLAVHGLVERIAALSRVPRGAHAVIVVLGCCLAVGLGVAGYARTTFDDNFIKFFGPSYPMRHASDYSAARLVGSYYVEYLLDAGSEGGATAPAFLQQADAFCAWLRARDDVAHAICLTDALKRIHANFHGDDPAYDILPDDPQLAAQLLLTLETSLPLGHDLGNQIDTTHRTIRVTALTPDISSAQLRALKRAGEAQFAKLTQGRAQASGTGVGVMFSFVSLRNINGMLLGTGVVVILVGLTFMALVRSVRLGIVAMIPNVAPLVAAFGVWGLVVHNIGMTVAVISAICVGIIVDDSIHFVVRYRERRVTGASMEAALAHAYQTAGTAMVITSAILITGFLVLGLSDFAVTWTMGYFAAITLALALVFDLLVLPGLIVLGDVPPPPQNSAIYTESGSASR